MTYRKVLMKTPISTVEIFCPVAGYDTEEYVDAFLDELALRIFKEEY